MIQYKKNVLISGANGFIGRNIVKFFLNKNYKVFSLVRFSSIYNRVADEQVIYFKNKIIDFNKSNKIDFIVHCAGNAHEENYSKDDLKDEKNFTISLLNYGKSNKITKFIYISSIKVNGNFTNKKAFKEDDNLNPIGLYAQNKLEIENIIKKFFINSSCNYYILRIPLVVGLGAKGNLLKIYNFISKYKFFINTNIKNKKKIISIDNLNNLINKIFLNSLFIQDVFLVCNDENISLEDILKILKEKNKIFIFRINYNFLLLIFKMINKKNIFEKLYFSQDIDNSKIKKILNWNPEKDFKISFSTMIMSFKING